MYRNIIFYIFSCLMYITTSCDIFQFIFIINFEDMRIGISAENVKLLFLIYLYLYFKK